MTGKDLTIQQAAEMTGLSVHTLRYYERIGLMDPIPVPGMVIGYIGSMIQNGLYYSQNLRLQECRSLLCNSSLI